MEKLIKYKKFNFYLFIEITLYIWLLCIVIRMASFSFLKLKEAMLIVIILNMISLYICIYLHCTFITKITYLLIITKVFPKERYNTYAQSCNSNLYTKYPSATYSGLLLGTMCCL